MSNLIERALLFAGMEDWSIDLLYDYLHSHNVHVDRSTIETLLNQRRWDVRKFKQIELSDINSPN